MPFRHHSNLLRNVIKTRTFFNFLPQLQVTTKSVIWPDVTILFHTIKMFIACVLQPFNHWLHAVNYIYDRKLYRQHKSTVRWKTNIARRCKVCLFNRDKLHNADKMHYFRCSIRLVWKLIRSGVFLPLRLPPLWFLLKLIKTSFFLLLRRSLCRFSARKMMHRIQKPLHKMCASFLVSVDSIARTCYVKLFQIKTNIDKIRDEAKHDANKRNSI